MTRVNRTLTSLALILWMCSTYAPSQEANHSPSVAQLYFYSVQDRPSFEEGYRRHLQWHASHNDQLVWYAWTIDSGPRKGDFADGTFGATFAGLDGRPDPHGDGADFVHNVSAYVTPLDVETWALWPSPSTGSPLEDRRPGATLDIFFLQVDPAEAASFESAVETLTRTKRQTPTLTWYRLVRGNNLPTYIVLFTRTKLQDIQSAGITFSEMLMSAYAASPDAVDKTLTHVRSMRTETWTYEPRLALIPGRALEP